MMPKTVTNGMNCMPFGNDLILFAGGATKKFFSYSISKKKFAYYPDLLLIRTFFGFGFIAECPIVVGGIIKNKASNIVEKFENNQWKFIERLNKPNSHCHVIVHNQQTYVFAGLDGINISIEKYESGWVLTEIKTSCKIIRCGLVSCENYIYLLGGKKKSQKYAAYRYDTINKTLSSCTNLAVVCKTQNQGSAVYFNNSIYYLGSSKKKICNYIPDELPLSNYAI